MTWYDRRAALLVLAQDTEGYGPIGQLMGERHIGRIIMQRKYGPWKGGFYPVGSDAYAQQERHFKAKHKKARMELPK